MPVDGKDEALLKASEVAAFLKINQDSVYRLVAEGRLPFVKIGKLTRFRPSDIRDIAANGLPTEGAA